VTTVQGERTFAAPPDRVFALLTDPGILASAMPGVRGHTVVDANHWHAKVKPPFPLAPSVTIRFEVVDRREPEHAQLRGHGGGADVRSTFDLAAVAEGTHMRWHTEISLSGILGRFAGPGLAPIAQRQAARMLDAVERSL